MMSLSDVDPGVGFIAKKVRNIGYFFLNKKRRREKKADGWAPLPPPPGARSPACTLYASPTASPLELS